MGKEISSSQNIFRDVTINEVDRGIILNNNWHNVEKVFSHLVTGDPAQVKRRTDDNVTQAMDWIDSDHSKWYGDTAHFNGLDGSNSRVNLFAYDGKPNIIEIYDDEELEKKIADKTGLERAHFAKYVFVELERKNGEHKINIKDVAQRLNAIVTKENPPLSEAKMISHFQENRYYSPYELGKVDEFNISLSLAGVSDERFIEDDTTMRFDSCDKIYPPRLSFEIIEGHWVESKDNKRYTDKIVYVADPDKKVRMEKVSQNIAKAFTSSV